MEANVSAMLTDIAILHHLLPEKCRIQLVKLKDNRTAVGGHALINIVMLTKLLCNIYSGVC